MEVQHDRCAGLDLARESLVACVRIQTGRKVTRHIETFGTTTRDLLRLSEWLQQHRCTHVVMEATGVYWEAVWQILQGAVEVIDANGPTSRRCRVARRTSATRSGSRISSRTVLCERASCRPRPSSSFAT